MKKQNQSRLTTTLPLWLRVCVCACLLLFTIGAIAQATHVHEDLPLHSKQHHSSQNDCQLCTAMHALLMAKTHTAPIPVAFIRCFAVHTSAIARSFLWRFELASRPPPATSLDPASQVAAAV